MNIPKISFIVPSYNFATHISECVNSILRQDMTSLEVIVVNDGSTDNTKEVLDGLALQDSRIVPIHKKNEGVSVARNTGLAVAKGEYVTFVDADDYLAADYANYMLELARIAESDFCLSLDAFTKVGENQMGGGISRRTYSRTGNGFVAVAKNNCWVLEQNISQRMVA